MTAPQRHAPTPRPGARPKAWADQPEGRISAGTFVDTSHAQRTTLGEVLERYLAEFTPTKRGHVQERNRIRAWLKDPLAHRSLASIRSVDIAEWRTARVAEGKAPTTIKNALQIVSQVYVVASTEWAIEGLRNPVRGVRMPKARPGRCQSASNRDPGSACNRDPHRG